MEKSALRLLVLLPIIAFFWCAQKVDASMTVVESDIIAPTVWKKENSPYVIRSKVTISAPLVIEPGVIVKFLNVSGSVTVSAYLSVNADLTAIGTTSEKIVFTSLNDDMSGGDTNGDGVATIPSRSDWVGITLIDSSAKMMFDHIVLSYSNTGIRYESIYKTFFKNLTVKNSEIKNNDTGFRFRSVLPVLENNIISNNGTGIATFSGHSDRILKISNSSIFNNNYGIDGRNFLSHSCTKVDATYNWWGDASGPQVQPYDGSTIGNPEGRGDLLYGSCIKFDPWFRRDPEIKRDPIILVPGIGASINPDVMIGSLLNDNWTMFDRTYDGLIKAIRSAGYIEGKDFFIAYYDWRKPNAESAENFLRPVIKKALASNPVGQVNIVAHSMGGLVARSYVQNSLDDDVSNLILIATPSRGSSDSYSLWEGGRVPDNWEGKIMMKAYIDYMKVKNLTLNPYTVVHKFIPSLKDLLPTYSYLYLAGNSQTLKDYLDMNEKNNFLLNLNSQIADLNEKTRFSIILGDNQPTVNKISVIESDIAGLWQDGKPFPINPEKTDENGDGRVLLTSGDIQSEFKDVLSFDHGDVVSEAEPIVMARLNETPGEIYRPITVEKEVVIWSEGPGEMKITDPNGKTVTKDSSSVADSKFSSQSESDGFKIASIPNPKNGEYKVTISAPNGGEFHAGTEFSDNKNDGNDSSSTIGGEIRKDEPIDLIVRIDPGNVEKPVSDIIQKDTVEPVIAITYPKNNGEYFNDQVLPVTFSVSDNVSALENIKIEMYLDDKLFEGGSIDLSLQTLGVSHVLRVYAFDESDNSSRSTVVFKVKKALPPIVVDPPVEIPSTVPPVIVPDPNTPPATESTPEVPPVDIPDPVTPPALILPPEIFLPVTSSTSGGGLVLGASIENSIFQNTQSISNQKSSKKKSSHKKKKHKKKKKNMISGVAEQAKKVLGTSISRNTKQKNVFTKSWNNVANTSTSFWQNTQKAANTFKNLILKPFNIFKR